MSLKVIGRIKTGLDDLYAWCELQPLTHEVKSTYAPQGWKNGIEQAAIYVAVTQKKYFALMNQKDGSSSSATDSYLDGTAC
jgi:hypothetical protein